MLVVGAGGYFGRQLVEELLSETSARVIAAGRDVARLEQTFCDRLGEGSRLSVTRVDLHDGSTVEAALHGVGVCIGAAGPFQKLPQTLLHAALAREVAYIDLSDDRRFCDVVLARAADAAVPVATGWSVLPALVGVLARRATEAFDVVTSLDLSIAPGNRMPRAHGTVASLLASVGRPIEVWRDGACLTVSGWSEPAPFDYPAPVGRRKGWLVDVPGLDVLGRTFGADRVEFRVGGEIGFLNVLVSALAWPVRWRIVPSWVPCAGLLRCGMALFGRFGTSVGAVGVEASGRRAGHGVRTRVTLVAEHDGHRIPVLPAVEMARHLLDGSEPRTGPLPPHDWIGWDDLLVSCERRGYRLNCAEATMVDDG